MYVHLPVAEMSIFIPEILGISLLVSMLAGLLGIGGAFILTPFMIALGIPASVAVGSSGGQVFASSYSSFWMYAKNKAIDYPLTFYLTLGGVIGIILGSFTFHALIKLYDIELMVRLGFILLLGGVGSFMILLTPKENSSSAVLASNHSSKLSLFKKIYFSQSKCSVSLFPLIMTGIIIGFLSGLLGIGGGFLIVPVLIYLLKIPARATLAIAQTYIMCVSCGGLFLHSILNKNVDPVLSLLLVVSGVLGATIGTNFATKLSQKATRILFAVIVLMTAGYLIYDTYFISHQDYTLIRHTL